MRLTMRPVTLSRVVETAYFAERETQFTSQELADFLKSSPSRGKEIAEETVNIGLLEKTEDHYRSTKNCSPFLENLRQNNWNGIHVFMMDYPFYHTFIKTLQSIEPATSEEILAALSQSTIPFNEASRQVLCDWGERLCSIQRNIFTNQYFTVTNNPSSLIPVFLETYQSLNIKYGDFQKRYVEIPKIREYVCQNLRISRDTFDTRFIQLCMKNIGKIELAGAPVTTHAKRSTNKVKNVHFLELPDTITMKLSSDQYLNGLKVGPKLYYSVAYHGGDLLD